MKTILEAWPLIAVAGVCLWIAWVFVGMMK